MLSWVTREKGRVVGIKESWQKDFCINRMHSKEEAMPNINIFQKLQVLGKENSLAVPSV